MCAFCSRSSFVYSYNSYRSEDVIAFQSYVEEVVSFLSGVVDFRESCFRVRTNSDGCCFTSMCMLLYQRETICIVHAMHMICSGVPLIGSVPGT